MQALHSKSRFRSIFLIGLVASVIAGCGGGGDDAVDTVSGLKQHVVTPSVIGDGQVGYRHPISSFTETFGPSISSVTWSVEPLGSATGDLDIEDASCSKGKKASRAIPGGDKVIQTWTCDTTAMPTEDAQGSFMVTSQATLSSGDTQSKSLTLTVK